MRHRKDVGPTTNGWMASYHTISVAHGSGCATKICVSVAHLETCATEIWVGPGKKIEGAISVAHVGDAPQKLHFLWRIHRDAPQNGYAEINTKSAEIFLCKFKYRTQTHFKGIKDFFMY